LTGISNPLFNLSETIAMSANNSRFVIGLLALNFAIAGAAVSGQDGQTGADTNPGLSIVWVSEQLSDIAGTHKKLDQLKKKLEKERAQIETESQAVEAEKARLTQERADLDARTKQATGSGYRVRLSGDKVIPEEDYHFIDKPYKDFSTYDDAEAWLKKYGGRLGGSITDKATNEVVTAPPRRWTHRNWKRTRQSWPRARGSSPPVPRNSRRPSSGMLRTRTSTTSKSRSWSSR